MTDSNSSAPPSSDSQWHFHTAATAQQGPVDFAQLQALARDGRLAPTDLVWTAGMAEWMPAAQVVGLHKPPAPPPLSTAAVDSSTIPPLSYTRRVTPPGVAEAFKRIESTIAERSVGGSAGSSAADAFDYSPFGSKSIANSGPSPTHKASGNFIVDHWRGQLSLGISFWVNGVLVSFVWRLLGFAMISGAQYSSGAVALVVIFTLLSLPLSVWILVGIWRSADRHESRGGKAGAAIVAKFLVGLGWLTLVFSVIALMGVLGGSRY